VLATPCHPARSRCITRSCSRARRDINLHDGDWTRRCPPVGLEEHERWSSSREVPRCESKPSPSARVRRCHRKQPRSGSAPSVLGPPAMRFKEGWRRPSSPASPLVALTGVIEPLRGRVGSPIFAAPYPRYRCTVCGGHTFLGMAHNLSRVRRYLLRVERMVMYIRSVNLHAHSMISSSVEYQFVPHSIHGPRRSKIVFGIGENNAE